MLCKSRLSWSKARWILTITLSLVATWAQAQDSHGLPPGMVARQGGVDVTLQDIDAFAQKIPEKDRAGFFDSPKRIEGVIMNLLLQRQLAREARAAKLEQEPLVQQQIELATEETLARLDVEHYRRNLKLPDFNALAQEYYLGHKDEYAVPGRIDVKDVLVSTKDRTEADAKSRIGEVESAAIAHPDQFDALVEKYSDDSRAKENQGLIEDVAAAPSKLMAPVAKAAGALKTPGDVSPIVKTDDGFHVLKLIERKTGTQRAFADVRPQIIEKLRSEWIDRQVSEHTGQMRGSALDANPDLVASLRTRYLPPDAVLPQDAAKAAAGKDDQAQH